MVRHRDSRSPSPTGSQHSSKRPRRDDDVRRDRERDRDRRDDRGPRRRSRSRSLEVRARPLSTSNKTYADHNPLQRRQRDQAADEIDQGTEEIDTIPESDHQIDDGAEVENGITETGETTLMTGHEDAARTLLTRGPVVEEMISVGSQPIRRMILSRAKSAAANTIPV
ncbi:hypothetical protein G7Y89_g1146 [Cudoniella acicularis]|uniref:Uncharacterized protein n=1 Tax=Cudoniella acicularis TaxID=354080 RepID=A0A8H4RXV4_9HELO|nr:hypothetical protein G7Y89_g1146 [Cudoniella acicularis]